MGQRLCKEEALQGAVVQGKVTAFYASAFLRYGRGDKLFAIVATDAGLKALTYDVLGRVEPNKISLDQPSEVKIPGIREYFNMVARKKRAHEFVDLRDTDLRRLASYCFPGSCFYGTFISQSDHMFSALPSVEAFPPDANTTQAEATGDCHTQPPAYATATT